MLLKKVAKKKFGKNSSIKMKNYILDKNEKKLNKNEINLILTEKEIQLLELFLNKKNLFQKMIFYPCLALFFRCRYAYC